MTNYNYQRDIEATKALVEKKDKWCQMPENKKHMILNSMILDREAPAQELMQVFLNIIN